MIPVSQNLINEQSGITTEYDFSASLKNLHVLFHIVRNQLYSDPILAVIREYYTNAVDAHKRIGQTAPVRISLPSVLDCFLKIRDFGPGLTEEEIKDVYVSYGESTKRNTQDETGMLGIGCKSAFAYNDSFIINSFKDGTLFSWNAYLDTSNRGKIALMAQVPTEEPNGIEIVVPIKGQDIHKFIEKAVNFLAYSDSIPNVVSVVEEVTNQITIIRKEKPMFFGEDWKFFAKQRPSIAVMGNIPYKIDKNVFAQGEITDVARQILDWGLVIKFNIGDIEFAANREGLQYTPRTKKVINEKLNAIHAALTGDISNMFAGIKTLWEARKLWRNVFDYGGNFYSLRFLFGSLVSFQGKKINSDTFSWRSLSESQVACRSYRVGYNKMDVSSTSEIKASEQNLVVENDTHICNGIAQRVIRFLHDGKYGKVYVLNFGNDEDKKKFLADTGLDCPMIKLSTLEKEPLSKYFKTDDSGNPTPVIVNKKHFKKVFYWDGKGLSRHSSKRSDFWKIKDIDPTTEEGVYVAISGFDFNNTISGSGWTHPYHLEEYIRMLSNLNIPVPEIIGLKNASQVQNNTKMKSFSTFFFNAITEYCSNNPDALQNLINQKHYKECKGNYSAIDHLIQFFVCMGDNIPKDAKELRDKALRLQDSMKSKTLDHLLVIIEFLDKNLLKTMAPTFDISSLVSDVVKKYSLLHLVASHYGGIYLVSSEWQEELKKYVRFKDAEICIAKEEDTVII